MTDHTIWAFEEQNLRLDTQEGVCGCIPEDYPENTLNRAHVALYLELGDPAKERVHNHIKRNLEETLCNMFTEIMDVIAEEITHPTPGSCNVS